MLNISNNNNTSPTFELQDTRLGRYPLDTWSPDEMRLVKCKKPIAHVEFYLSQMKFSNGPNQSYSRVYRIPFRPASASVEQQHKIHISLQLGKFYHV